MHDAKGGRLELGGLVIDLSSGVLTRDGADVPLRAKSFALLGHFLRHPGQVLTRDDLLDAVWPDVAVTPDSLTQAIRDIRVALGEEAGHRLRTLHGRGYLFDASAAPAPAPSAVPHHPVRNPRLGILPFVAAAVSPALAPLVELVADEIAAGLARFRSLQVLSRGSVEAAAADTRDPGEIARRLQADYLIGGTAYPTDGGFWLRVTLDETASGTMAWSGRFDCTGERLLDAQGAVLSRIVGHLFANFEVDTGTRAMGRPTESLTAYEHYARGNQLMQSERAEAAGTARAHYRAAVEADQEFGLAWSGLAFSDLAHHDFGGAPQAVKDRALSYAMTAVELAPDESRTHTNLGWVQVIVGDYVAAEANVRKGLALNPTSYDGILELANVMLGRGRPAETLASLDRMGELSPVETLHVHITRAEALYMLGRYEEAVESIAKISRLSLRRRTLFAAMLAQAGRDDESRAQLRAIAAAEPDFDHLTVIADGYPYEHPSDAEHLLDGVRKALALVKD